MFFYCPINLFRHRINLGLVNSENFPHPFVPHIHLSSVEDKESLYRFVKLFLRGEDRSFPSFRHDHF